MFIIGWIDYFKIIKGKLMIIFMAMISRGAMSGDSDRSIGVVEKTNRLNVEKSDPWLLCCVANVGSLAGSAWKLLPAAGLWEFFL